MENEKNSRVKIIGYGQRQFYNDGLEYRNFSDDLVGNQQTTPVDGSQLTMQNFITTTTDYNKINKTYTTKKFSKFYNLENLNISENKLTSFIDNNIKLKLNVDDSKIKNYAYFGSAVELVRVSLENIIKTFPASLYVNPKNSSNGLFTVLNCQFNFIKNESNFQINTNSIDNKYGINFLTNGNSVNNSDIEEHKRNLTVEFLDYVVLYEGVEYPLIDFKPADKLTNGIITLTVKGNVFNVSNGANISKTYHIKPKDILVEEFFNSLNNFESTLLNRLTKPKYTTEFKYKYESIDGNIINALKTFTYPATDGYNLDYDTSEYIRYVNDLIDLAKNSDGVESDLNNRFLVSESISDFDTIQTCEGETKEPSSQKVNKLLRVYGRSFDEVKKYIDGISFSNVVTYDKRANTPDQTIKMLGKNLGWNLISSIDGNTTLSNLIDKGGISYPGYSKNLTTKEADVELWRRLVINSAWIWKSKGTRKSIELFFKLIGAPDGLINFNEFVYLINKPINVEELKLSLKNNNLDTNVNLYNVDSEGYPRFKRNRSDMYFQNDGQWYRETAGANSTIDILDGNNPHIGPYDNGSRYLAQLDNIIPNFKPFTVTGTTITKSEEQLFENYSDGLINRYDGDFYIEGKTLDNLNANELILIEPKAVIDNCPSRELTDCGCDPIENDKALRLDMKYLKKCVVGPDDKIDCGDRYVSHRIDPFTGTLLLTRYDLNIDGTINTSSTSESSSLRLSVTDTTNCCESIEGFESIPPLKKGEKGTIVSGNRIDTNRLIEHINANNFYHTIYSNDFLTLGGTCISKIKTKLESNKEFESGCALYCKVLPKTNQLVDMKSIGDKKYITFRLGVSFEGGEGVIGDNIRNDALLDFGSPFGTVEILFDENGKYIGEGPGDSGIYSREVREVDGITWFKRDSCVCPDKWTSPEYREGLGFSCRINDGLTQNEFEEMYNFFYDKTVNRIGCYAKPE